VKVLCDEGVPLPLIKRFPSEWKVDRVQKIGLGGAIDGKILEAAEKFDVFVTTDKNIEAQHHPEKFKTPRYVLSTTSWPKLQNELDKIVNGITALCPQRGNLEDLPVDE
jgi:hypothetical protein